MSQRKVKFFRILVGIDGSQSSIDAAGYEIEMAKRDNAELIVIHVLSTKLGGDKIPLSLYYSVFQQHLVH